MCPTLTLPVDLQYPPSLSVTGPVNHGAVVEMECSLGQKYTVVHRRYCLYDIITDTYDLHGDQLDCPVIDCGPPRFISGVVYGNANSTLYGAKVNFR